MAPYSLAPESVTSKGSAWSEYQGVANWEFWPAEVSEVSS
jgi:hypothetical protein